MCATYREAVGSYAAGKRPDFLRGTQKLELVYGREKRRLEGMWMRMELRKSIGARFRSSSFLLMVEPFRGDAKEAVWIQQLIGEYFNL